MTLVLTGGPSAGKTALAQLLLKEFNNRVAIVPETASILFYGGFPRGQTDNEVRHQQRAIYYVQRELEEMIAETHSKKLIVCDRGTLDGLAYWPGSRDEFFKSLNTSLHDELKRYDFVIHLVSAGPAAYDYRNPMRIESASRASRLDEKIQEIWSQHPNRYLIHNSQQFSKKLEAAIAIVELILKRTSIAGTNPKLEPSLIKQQEGYPSTRPHTH